MDLRKRSSQEEVSSSPSKVKRVISQGARDCSSKQFWRPWEEATTSREAYKKWFCPLCKIQFKKNDLLSEHMYRVHGDSQSKQRGQGFSHIKLKLKTTSHQKALVKYEYEQGEEEIDDLRVYMDLLYGPSFDVVKGEKKSRGGMKIWTSIRVLFEKQVEGQDKPDQIRRAFTSFPHRILDMNFFANIWDSMEEHFDEQIKMFTCLKSGWKVKNIYDYNLLIGTYKPLFGSSYIPLPDELSSKRGCILNINNSKESLDNDHQKCFLWSVLAHPEIGGIPKSRVQYRKDKLVESYKTPETLSKVNDIGIKYPMTTNQIKRFEKQNPNIGFCIISYDMDADLPENNELSKKSKRYKLIKLRSNLLYSTEEERPIIVDLILLMHNGRYHFALIKNLSHFLAYPSCSQKRFFCRTCLQGYQTQNTYKTHVKYCADKRLQMTTFPEVDDVLYFNQYRRELKVPYVLYCDFEALLPKLDFCENEYGSTNVQRHVCDGYGIVCVDFNGNRVPEFSKYYRVQEDDIDVAALFIKDVVEINKKIQKEIDKYQENAASVLKQLLQDPEVKQKLDIQRAEGECSMCHRKFNTDDKIHTHHTHFPPFEISLTHEKCNMTAQVERFLPVFFHNLGSYDVHFIVKCLSTLKTDGVVYKVDAVPKSSEKFLTLTINNDIRFLDSFQFTMASLEKLVETMSLDPNADFKIVKQEFAKEIKEGGDFNLLLKKGLYPYARMTAVKDFELTSLPPIEDFYNDLSESPCKLKDYEHAEKVWQSFTIKNMGEYHDLYMRLDTALLADVMESMRRIMKEAYSLDLPHYFSIPMLSWDALLKKSGVVLDYITDPDMYLFAESAIRGGYVSVGSVRSCEANNPFMNPDLKMNPQELYDYLILWDCVNLYGRAMCESVPCSDYQWLARTNPTEYKELKDNPHQFLQNLDVDGEYGYLIECDLIIEEKFHDKFNDYPPAPHSRGVDYMELCAAHQHRQLDELSINPGQLKNLKLVADLHNKNGYIAHSSVLKVYQEIGVKITNIGKVLKFKQSKWMKIFIDFNSAKRREAKTDFEKDFWKLLSNSAFGKTMEDKRDRQNVIFILSKEQLIKYLKKPTVSRLITIDENCTIALMKRATVKLDKMILCGASILDIAKSFMYNFHYNYIQKYYGDRASLVYTDTDGILYNIKSNNVYQDCLDNKAWFDLSVYEPNHPIFGSYHDSSNKKVPGKFKDEYALSIITHVVALKPKLYGLRRITLSTRDGDFDRDSKTQEPVFKAIECLKAKGLTKASVKNHLPLAEYKKALEENFQSYVTMTTIKSSAHEIHTEKWRKKALNGLDTKRYCVNKVHTLALGHKDIPLNLKVYKS